MTANKPLLTAKEIAQLAEKEHIHQHNDNAIRMTRSLSDATGINGFGIHMVRVNQGRESTEFHSHQQDEEFIYILSGEGIATIGDEQFHISKGDFMGFSKNSQAHSMFNPNREDLVYLMGGSRSDMDICDYPRLQRRQFRVNGRREFTHWDNLTPVQSDIS
jgi:uncharacterized cupin superfamily protein